MNRYEIEAQISASLGSFAGDYDVESIADEVIRLYGLSPIDNIDEDEYWEIVDRHEVSAIRSKQMRIVYGRPDQEVATRTADRIVDLLRDGEGTQLRETVKHDEYDQTAYRIELVEYALNGETRVAVVVSNPHDYVVEDHTDRAVAERHYERKVRELTEAFTPLEGMREPVWDASDVKDLPDGAVAA